MLTDLSEKVALVTGGSRGIGRAVALSLARCGATVVVNYARNADAAAAVVSQIEALGQQALAVQADVGDFEQAAKLVKTTLAEFGRIDILVNNAGITRDALLMRMQEQEWDEVLRVNLKGVFNTCQAVSRSMMRQRAGRIINIGSVVGLMGQAGQVNYAAAKAGLIGLTKSLARELGGRGITANVVAPGFVPTDMTDDLDQVLQDRVLALIPLGHFAQVEDIAHAVTFLASNEAAYITGVVLPVDGGLSM